MTFHFPSFVLGLVTGASGAVLAPRLRPIAVELATAYYRLFDSGMLRIARGRENISDLLAEARARARIRFQRNGAQLRTVEATA